MQTEDMIMIDEFCIHHKVEKTFIYTLEQSGLVTLTTIEQKTFVPVDQLSRLEKIVRLYYDMDINVEGIEAISHLLQKVNDMQQQIVQLNNRLRLYEDE